MSLQNQNFDSSSPQPKSKRSKPVKETPVDFCKIGGLGYHLNLLREIIIFPLLHGNVFSHFNIKAPRGVLFHGPPGTGKTLVAAALANELNKEGIGKVAFFPRKGADVLDKWVGGSEKNLRDLFEKASKCKPSIIFFDELDGLAPIREKQMDQIHSSVVTTLLALMDGLDNKPGVIVIGATNRIEAIDPALRRPGRFDKELYFPLPGVDARKQILEVHTSTWRYKPNNKLLTSLVEATAGFSGADLQALCSESILRCMKRSYPCLKTVKIEPEKLKVEECDFLHARLGIVPSTQKSGFKMRKLTAIIEPLLGGQLQKIVRSIQMIWPHFLEEDYRYMIGEERYAGRVLITGNSMQGVDSHVIPAVLQRLEYLPVFIYDITYILKKNTSITNHLHFPSVILLSRVDDWWHIIDECEQMSIASSLEDIHANLPILVIATCRKDLPPMLENFFYNNSSIRLKIEDPTEEERKAFLKPLFFEKHIISLVSVLHNSRKVELAKKNARGRRAFAAKQTETANNNIIGNNKEKRKREGKENSPVKRNKRQRVQDIKDNLVRSNSVCSLYCIHKDMNRDGKKCPMPMKRCDSLNSLITSGATSYFNTVLSGLINHDTAPNENATQLKTYLSNKKLKLEVSHEDFVNSNTLKMKDDAQMQHILTLWKHTSLVTSKNMTVAQLELLYDVISACINIHWNRFESLIKKLEDILKDIENSNSFV